MFPDIKFAIKVDTINNYSELYRKIEIWGIFWSLGFFIKIFEKLVTHMPVNLKVILQIITMTKTHSLATQLSRMLNINL